MRIAIYARVSSKSQVQGQSIEQQLERLLDSVRQREWPLSRENIFRDDGFSGASLGRPGLDRLRDKVRLAEIDRVLVTAPDRLARNYVHQMVLLEELERFGCEVEFLDRPISNDPHDQLLLQIRGAVAEYERTLIAERMRRGRLAKYRAGTLLPWSVPPYGFRTDPERPRDPAGVRHEPAEAAIVAQIFAWFLEQHGTLGTVAKQLQTHGVASPTGMARWSKESVRNLLANPAYAGHVFASRTRSHVVRSRRSPTQPVGHTRLAESRLPREEWIEVAAVPAMVTQEQYELAFEKLERNKRMARRNNTANEYLCRALVSCGVCGMACMARRLPSGHSYYHCTMKSVWKAPNRPHECRSRYMPSGKLDELVWNDLCQILTDTKIITHELERAWSGQWLPQEVQARRAHLRKGRASLANQVERLTEAYLGGVLGLQEYERRRRELDGKTRALESQERAIEAEVDRQAELSGAVASIEAFSARIRSGLESAAFDLKRQLVELLVDRVMIADGDVEIRYVIPTSPEGGTTRFCHLRQDYFAAFALAHADRHALAVDVLDPQVQDFREAEPGGVCGHQRRAIERVAHGIQKTQNLVRAQNDRQVSPALSQRQVGDPLLTSERDAEEELQRARGDVDRRRRGALVVE